MQEFRVIGEYETALTSREGDYLIPAGTWLPAFGPSTHKAASPQDAIRAYVAEVNRETGGVATDGTPYRFRVHHASGEFSRPPLLTTHFTPKKVAGGHRTELRGENISPNRRRNPNKKRTHGGRTRRRF